MNKKEVASMIKFGKERAAFQQASHAVAHLSFGIPCRVWIKYDEHVDTQVMSPWNGMCQSYRIESKLGFKITQRMAAICAVAGAVGENIHFLNGYFPESSGEWHKSKSPTNRESIGGYSMIQAAREAYPLLTEKWPAVAAIAKRLLKDGELTDRETGTVYNKALRIKGEPISR